MKEEFNLTSLDVTVPEWNLSEKIITSPLFIEGALSCLDVKEFVRRLKAYFIQGHGWFEMEERHIAEFIDKLAGEELSK